MSSSHHVRAIVAGGVRGARPLARAHRARPEPGAIVATVELAGVCGTDVHLQAGRLPIPLPVVLGHEGVGRVGALGDGVTVDALGAPLAAGDLIAWGSSISCGDCFYCRDAQEPTLCERRRIYGINRRADEWPRLGGAWAEAIYLHPGTMVVRLEPDMPPEAVIALGCAGPTAVHGLLGVAPRGGRRDGRGPGRGSGRPGDGDVRPARRRGACGASSAGPRRGSSVPARSAWATCISTSTRTPRPSGWTRCGSLTGGRGGDLVVEATGAPAAVAEGIDLCRPGGRYLVLGQYTDHGPTPAEPAPRHPQAAPGPRVVGVLAGRLRHRTAHGPPARRAVRPAAPSGALPALRRPGALDAARAGEVGKAVLVPAA